MNLFIYYVYDCCMHTNKNFSYKFFTKPLVIKQIGILKLKIKCIKGFIIQNINLTILEKDILRMKITT